MEPDNQKKPENQKTLKPQEVKQEADNFVVNPYDVVNNTGKDLDYKKLIKNFGCFQVQSPIIQRIQKLTGSPAHRFLRRNIFCAHRDLDLILNAYENQKKDQSGLPPFYLYTGRGPSSEALHLGHMLPFIFNKYFQEAFNVPLIIQITDDEKYFHKQGEDLQSFTKLARQNIKDILALGFDPQKTFIFIDSQYMGYMYENVCRFQRNINMSTLKAIFGLTFSDNCGKAAYPAIQAAPCLSSSFPHIFGKKNLPCLIPCGIDQDPYFRMTRDVCAKIKAPKPAGLYSKFFPSLQGFGTKMSGSVPNSGIFMTDTPKQIENKIKKHAYSGGGKTKQQHQKNGANLQVDIAYNYLKFFMQDDQKLKEIGELYGSGKMMTGQVKKILIEIIQKFVAQHQARRKQITQQVLNKFLAVTPRKFFYK